VTVENWITSLTRNFTPGKDCPKIIAASICEAKFGALFGLLKATQRYYSRTNNSNECSTAFANID
jgi:hypothetical protein